MAYNWSYDGSGGDSGARAAGFGDFADYQLQKARRNEAGGGNNSGGGMSIGASSFDPIAAAQKAQAFQVQANQPAIQTLNTQKSSLDTKYSDLLKSITDNQQPALDSAARTTNSELAKRGITGDSTMAQQEINNSQVPIRSATNQLIASTGQQRESELTNLASRIADLQAGNAQGALGFSSNIGNLENQAQQIGNQFTLGQQQNDISKQNLDLELQKLAQELSQQKIQNGFTQQGIGISAGNLQLGRDQLNAQYGYNGWGG